jgi:hypothetical protein
MVCYSWPFRISAFLALAMGLAPGHTSASPRSIHFIISRHAGGFGDCSSVLLDPAAFGDGTQPVKADRMEPTHKTDIEVAPISSIQKFYFAEMQKRKTLSESEVAYYSSLTHELDPGSVSFVSSAQEGVYDSALMLVSGQKEQSQIHALPFERQFRSVKAERGDGQFVWEIGSCAWRRVFFAPMALWQVC